MPMNEASERKCQPEPEVLVVHVNMLPPRKTIEKMSAGLVSVRLSAPHDNALKTLRLQRDAAERGLFLTSKPVYLQKCFTTKN